jgi:bla regulator protein blaR1
MITQSLASLEAGAANHIWQSTLFAGLVALLTLAVRRNRAQIRFVLWMAASLKFLLPFSLLATLGGFLVRPMPTGGQPAFYVVVNKATGPFVEPEGTMGAIWLVWLAGFATAIGLFILRHRRAAKIARQGLLVSGGREVMILRRLEKSAGRRTALPLRLSPSSLEPGVFGILNPVLIWPERISEHLQDAHIEAILTHELEHVRRRDNLAATLHMLVEAAFWFHPVVWWVGARLVEERERACDEAVVEMGKPASVYAESILRTCKFSVSSPISLVSGAGGGDLKERIVRIMRAEGAEKLGLAKKALLAAAGILAISAPVVVGILAPSSVAAANLTEAEQIYHVGGDVSAPKLIFAPAPDYTDKARKAKYQGVCVVSVVVDKEGKTRDIRVERHLEMGLDEKAVEAVRQYKFEPARRFGKPVAVQVHIEINFRVF